MSVVRGLNQGDVLPGVKPGDREEIVAISAFKRTLDQFETAYEFYGALIGVLKAIESLAQAGIIHRDISPGNVVLEEEIYATSGRYEETKLDEQTAQVFLVRRAPVSLDAVGGLHDLGMATVLSPPSETTSMMLEARARKLACEQLSGIIVKGKDEGLDVITGTTPYISIPVLSGGQRACEVYDDLQSTFFVQYLSLFSCDHPKPNCYPERPTQQLSSWPDKCLQWADSPSVPFSSLGWREKNFEHGIDCLTTSGLDCQEFWKVGGWKVDDTVVLAKSHTDMLLAVQGVLWVDSDRDDWLPKYSATPRQIVDALETELEKNKHLMGWVAPLDDSDTRAQLREEGVSRGSELLLADAPLVSRRE
ncbi:hypothetical protein H0H81_005597 [Sphagnurus paluster]|uniref:Protein kinase domain-containing protein n=1 Tax=Sphagnurus paluster TaxID=117069 RepID=A0A9P7K511_9AGAR|nr:hypothetical protein H0H81_005597 [Sphagnurus paluster]